MLATPWALSASETTDRVAVDKVFFQLKDALAHRDRNALGKLLASGANREELTTELLNLDPAAPDSKSGPWTEMSRTVLIIDSVQFPEKNRAEVATMASQYGPVASRRSIVVLLLKRERSGWKIESLRAGLPPR
jgi:hypothetical protein